MDESAFIEKLRKRKKLKYFIGRMIIRFLQSAAIISLGWFVWVLRPVLVSAMISANTKLSTLGKYVLSLRF